MSKKEIIESVLSYYEDYLSALTKEELKRVLAQAENNQVSI